MTIAPTLRARENEMRKMVVLVALLLTACDKSPGGTDELIPPPPLPPQPPHRSALETCEAICEAREQIKEQTARRDALQREVDELKQKIAARTSRR